MWRVTLNNIEWDGGKGDHDVSGLPKRLIVDVSADDSAEAIEFAMESATDYHCMLISNCDVTSVTKLSRSE